MLNLTKQEKTIYWKDHISKFVTSGKSQRSYCKDNDLSYSKFKGWRYKFANEFPVNQNHPRAVESRTKKAKNLTPTPSITINKFAPVELVADSTVKPEETKAIKLFLNKNIYIELPPEIATDNLNKIFAALGVLSC